MRCFLYLWCNYYGLLRPCLLWLLLGPNIGQFWILTYFRGWFMDIDTVTDILTESHTCLAKVKSHCLICTLICEATQTERCWDEIIGILRLKLWDTNIHTYTSQSMGIQQKDNETLAAYIHHFKTAAK